MNDSADQPRKSLLAILAIVAAAIILIITISVLAVNLSNKEEAKIVNDSDRNSEQISDEDMNRVKKEIYTLLNRTQSANRDFDAVVRWDTVTKTTIGNYPTTSFIVDIDEYKQTYRISVDSARIRITCPELGESKYPESFCISNDPEGNDSIDLVLGSLIPYNGETDSGIPYSFTRNDSTSMKNTNDRYLSVIVYACPFDDSVKDEVNQSIDELITSLGAPADLFERKYLSGGGCIEG